jgi:hypothetical protein
LMLALVRAGAFLKHDAQGLHTLLQEIRFKRELQSHAQSEHFRRIRARFDQEVLPSSEKIVDEESWQVVSNQPVGGVALAIAFCNALAARFAESSKETRRVLDRVKAWQEKGTCIDPEINHFFPDFVLLMVVITFLGLVLTIVTLAVGTLAIGFPGLLQQAFPLDPSSFLNGNNLLLYLLTFGYSGDFFFGILSRGVNFIKHRKEIGPDANPPVLRESYIKNWLAWLGVSTTFIAGLMILQWLATGGPILLVLILLLAVITSSGIAFWEYNWTNRRYQQALDQQKKKHLFDHIPSRGQIILSAGLALAHNVALVILAMLILSLLDTLVSPEIISLTNQYLWRWLALMTIVEAVKYIFDYYSARLTVPPEKVNYSDIGSGLGTAFFIFQFLIGLIGLTIARSPFHEIGVSRLRNMAITSLVLFTLYLFAVYMFRRIRLHEFALVFPPTSSPSTTIKQAEENGRKALRNSDWRIPLWRGAVMIALTIVVMAWLEQRFAASILSCLLTGLQFQIADPNLEDRILLIAILGAFYVLRYAVDLIFVFARRENLPSTLSLMLSLLLPILVTIAVCISVTLEIFPFGDWIDVAHRERVVQAVVLLGGIALFRYLWEYVNDLARIWYLAKDWIVWLEKMALQRIRIEYLHTATNYYTTMQDHTKKQADNIEQFKARVGKFRSDFVQLQSVIKGQLIHAAADYEHLVLDPDRAEDIYRGLVLADIAPEAVTYFKRSPLLEAWRGQSIDTVSDDLKAYINERFGAYWREHGVINFLSDNTQPTHPTYIDLERRIGWLFAKASKPYWQYYGATHGEFFAYVGVPARESGELKEAVLGLAGPLVGGPVRDLVTGDPYSVTSITFRHGISLSLLSSIAQYQRAYQDQIKSSPLLHAYGTPIEEPKGPFTESPQARISRDQTRPPRRQPPQNAPQRNNKRRAGKEVEGAVALDASLPENTNPKSMGQQTQDYYQILGVSRGATSEEIERAYGEQIFRYRPSAFRSDEGDKMRVRLRQALDVLMDRELRRKYDATLDS